MATSTNEITPNFIKWFAEKSVREHFFPGSEGVRIFTMMNGFGDIIATTNMDDRQFKIVRDIHNDQIYMFVIGSENRFIL